MLRSRGGVERLVVGIEFIEGNTSPACGVGENRSGGNRSPRPAGLRVAVHQRPGIRPVARRSNSNCLTMTCEQSDKPVLFDGHRPVARWALEAEDQAELLSISRTPARGRAKTTDRRRESSSDRRKVTSNKPPGFTRIDQRRDGGISAGFMKWRHRPREHAVRVVLCRRPR